MIDLCSDYQQLAFVYPGVGSQHTGMGKTFFDEYEIVKETYQEASQVLGVDIAELCFDPGKEKELNRLENAKPAIVCQSVATTRLLEHQIGIRPSVCMGHSLGEYSALVASGVMRFQDALNIVRKRALIINEVSRTLDGTMAWVVNLDAGILDELCAQTSQDDSPVYVSAYDSPEKLSVSGDIEQIRLLAPKVEDAGGMVIPINMSGPFHSPFMQEAGIRLEKILQNYYYSDPRCTIIANQNAQAYTADIAVDNLSRQLIRPILWMDSVNYLIRQGVKLAVEIGPKTILKYLMAQSTDAVETISMTSLEDLRHVQDHMLVTSGDIPMILNRCMGAITSTKNRNHDPTAYRQSVMTAYYELKNLTEQLEAEPSRINGEQCKNAFELVDHILKGKDIPKNEQQLKMNHVFGNKIIARKEV